MSDEHEAKLLALYRELCADVVDDDREWARRVGVYVNGAERAAKAEGERAERARVVAWLRQWVKDIGEADGMTRLVGGYNRVSTGTLAETADAVERGDHVASAPAAGAEVCPKCKGAGTWADCPCPVCRGAGVVSGGTGRRST